MKEIGFQDLMVELINKQINSKKFVAYRGKPILYELKVNEDLEVVGNPKKPSRGSGAFETDVTIFAKKGELEIPFIIIEVKEALTTHDVITYSNKEQRHKLVYPFLRDGLVASGIDSIPKRFFKHNKEIDFFLTVGKHIKTKNKLVNVLHELVKNELKIFNNL